MNDESLKPVFSGINFFYFFSEDLFEITGDYYYIS